MLLLGLLSCRWGQAEENIRIPLNGRAITTVDCSAKKPSVSVPFTLQDGLPVVRVTVNGRKEEAFVIDSGFERTVLNSDQAAKLQVSLSEVSIGTVLGSGDSKGQSLLSARSLRLKFGKTLILKGDIPAVSLIDLSSKLGLQISGIIGYDLFRANTTALDYIHKKFLIYKSKEFGSEHCANSAEFTISGTDSYPVLTTEMGVAEQDFGTARVLIDTGFQRGLMMTRLFGRLHHLTSSQDWKQSTGTGIGGDFKYLYGSAGWIRLGAKRLTLSQVSISQAKEGLSATNTYDALMGGSILMDYEIIFDTSHSRTMFVGSDLTGSLSSP